jgi:molybdenum cofactor cytidylyltransferase
VRRLSGVLLAAGASLRLGRPKQLLVWRGEPLVRRAARAALDAGVDELIVVVGAESEAVAAAVAGLDLRVLENDRWPDGIGSSIAAGVGAASGSAVLLLLADQPGVDAALLTELIAGMEAGHERVACGYEEVIGVPALFSAPSDLAALRALSGERGARGLLRRTGAPVLVVPAQQAAHDIDDEADWRRWRASTGAAARSRGPARGRGERRA